MRLTSTNLADLRVIHLDEHVDSRGSFIKPFNESFFRKHRLKCDFKEYYFSISQKDVIRGMHMQQAPFDHAKVVFVNQGAILDVVLDLRETSDTFGHYFTTCMDQDNAIALYIPPGFAHGFLSLADASVVSYLQTSEYCAHADTGIHYASFGFDWPCKNPIISERDNLLAPLKSKSFI